MATGQNMFLRLLTLFGATSAATLATSSLSQSCHYQHYPGPENPNFETGTLQGWTILGGNAYTNDSVSSNTTYSDGPFNQNGKYFLSGYQVAGDTAVGSIRSSSFRASSVMSFLISGGWDPENLYVGLVREDDNAVLLRQSGNEDDAFVRIIWDTRSWAGEMVYVVLVDQNNGTSYTHINIDDVRTGCSALGDGDLTFRVMGQANQPSSELSTTPCHLYAADPSRPQYHYTIYQGWINDPCGLIQWGGFHHRFAQYTPHSTLSGVKVWSHAESVDGVHWRNLPVALGAPYPETPEDQSGRWTGSAVRDPATGDLRVLFTEWTDTSFHPQIVVETVWTATSPNGIDFSYYKGNPVIPEPPPNSASGFRDPKMFYDPTEGVWKAVVGSGDSTSGKIYLYSTEDFMTWTYVGILFETDGSTGTMWECPNFFPLEDKWILFYGGNGQGWYQVGSFNGTTFTSEQTGLLDYGPDAYAAQWYKDEQGRNMVVTWMNSDKNPSRLNGWVGQHSFTREMFIRADGGLGNRPIEEVALLASGHTTSLRNQNVEGHQVLGSGASARLQIAIDLEKSSSSNFTLHLLSSSAESTDITFIVPNNTLIMDTSNSGYSKAGTWTAEIDVRDSKLALDVLLDHSSLEVFAQDGTVMGATIFVRYAESDGISLQSGDGNVWIEEMKLTPLGSGWC